MPSDRAHPPARPAAAPCLHYGGIGTERLEREVQGAFPEPRLAAGWIPTRCAGRAVTRRCWRTSRPAEVQILLGTQMIAKGLDFPNVTLVGVVNADTALHLPDFRAAERTFQLVAQVAGRTGRGDRPGRVLVQTYCPDHPAICHAVLHDYEGFAASELPEREKFGVPPFGRMVRLIARGPEEAAVYDYMKKLAAGLCQAAACLGSHPRSGTRAHHQDSQPVPVSPAGALPDCPPAPEP